MNRKVKTFLVLSYVALAVYVSISYMSAGRTDWPFADSRSFGNVENLGGPLGSLIAYASFALLGIVFSWFLPCILLVFSLAMIVGQVREAARVVVKTAVIVVLLNSFFALISFTRASDLLSGWIGSSIASGLSSVLGEIGATILLITALMLVSLRELRYFAGLFRSVFKGMEIPVPSLSRLTHAMATGIGTTIGKARRTAQSIAEASAKQQAVRAEKEPPPPPPVTPPEDPPWMEEFVEKPPRIETRPHLLEKKSAPKPKPVAAPSAEKALDGTGPSLDEAVLPPMSILETADKSGEGFSSSKLKDWSAVMENKLSNYGIEGKVTAVNQGPLVTTFEFEPAPGVKIKDIVSRSDDLALAMRARSLRLIAPIPGRAVVGIEIPNPEQEVVYMYDVLNEIPDRLRLSGIMFALGVDATGRPFHMNMCNAPHILMAGTTGSGKSVSLNCFLASILIQYHPSDVRLLLVDPKMVEMSMYNGIPHLLHPVITDPREAVKVFNFLIAEMTRRNELFQKTGVKNIESYNSKIALGVEESDDERKKLPYIVLVVDELGDLVLTKGADIESLLSRLSNMARAVGIHMMVATQRPSVDVLVGKTKANFPTRIAFRVASRVDSRTILDCIGAEKLLGKGDMLYIDAKHPEPLRLHGAWISDEEVERLVAHWNQYQFEESRLEIFESTPGLAPDEEKDPYFEDAKEIILHYKQGSTSLLQRKLHVGYARAARLLDQLENARIVGPPDGSKPREVLISREQENAAQVGERPDGQ